MYRFGIDVGGTFTDVVLVDEVSGALTVAKVLNTGGDRASAMVRGVTRVMEEAGIGSDAVRFIAHGTTITTNAVIERKGVATALVTNKGFRDVLELGKFARPAEMIYRVQLDRPQPLVPRHLRFEVDCRIGSKGQVLKAPDPAEIEALAEAIRASGVRAVAIAFLFAFLNPDHESEVATALRAALPGVAILTSHEVRPEFREFPRTSTTVFAAYIEPVIRDYLEALIGKLSDAKVDAPLFVFQSSGGVARPEIVLKNPTTTLLSGPAGAVVGSTILCGQAGLSNMITIDMGGTSLDVCLIRGGIAEATNTREIDGFPVNTPMLDVHTIGAGGGSIVAIDEVGRVTVGPESAGAQPGPACYGRGGTEPTITDVNLILGYLDPAKFAGGEVPLDIGLAETALQTIADPLGTDLLQTAAGVHGIATSQMAEAIRFVSVQRGLDPRDFAMIAFGGGGPIHAHAIARELGMATVVVPRHPGLFSARGIGMADFTHDYAASLMQPLDSLDPKVVEAEFTRLEAEAAADLTADNIPREAWTIERRLDIRYRGQNTEIAVPLEGSLAAARAAFDAKHEELYTYSVPSEPVEVVNLRLRAVGRVDKPNLPVLAMSGGSPKPEETRMVWFPGASERIATAIYPREALRPGHRLTGPALVYELSSTTVVPPGAEIAVDRHDNLIMNLEAQSAENAA
ncbi:hydantoinase/oxoprolinase family protein [Acuticoccus kandeliae]|uniref:hydantoinase/oxoprolinase family protein n=1 Tax=Acuticoccus kandeliae TaxID=2073160 RepID=UPI000D3E9888|nr:hydantoinase/oxoprolinase family protein [Acuticoccus kandeliae]